MSTTRWKSLRSSCRKRVIELATPALFAITWRPPNRSTVKSTSACTWSASVTSVCWKAATSPSAAASGLAGLGVDVGDDDPGALLDEALDGGPADAAAAAGDDGDLPCELVSHRSAPVPRPRSMPRREVAEHHRVGDARPRPEVVAAHDRGGAVAGGVEALDGLVLLVEHPGVLVGDEAAAGADVAGQHLAGVVRAPRRWGRGTGAPCGSDRPATGCRRTRRGRSRGRRRCAACSLKCSTVSASPSASMPHMPASSASVARLLQPPALEHLASGSTRGATGRGRSACGTGRRRSASRGRPGSSCSRSYMALPTSMYEFDSFTNRRPSAST